MQAQTVKEISYRATDRTAVYSDYIIYVDESGDHSLNPINSYYPVFVLDFCIFRKDHYTKVVTPRIQEFKFKYFGHDIIVLHEHEIRKRESSFAFLQNQQNHAVFMDDLNQIIEQTEFAIIAVVIRKEKLKSKYAHLDNTYDIALTFCMEMAYEFLRDIGQHERTTHIVVEKRGRREDNELELTFRRICGGANRLGEMPCFEIIFADKKVNSAGLQLADLTARPIGLYALRSDQSNRAWDIIKPKIHQNLKGQMGGRGLRIFP